MSEITDQLWEDYQAFIARDLSDAVDLLLRRHLRVAATPGGQRGAARGLVHDSEGRKHLLHLAVGNKESEAAWTTFFRDMVRRGMRLPTTVTTDGAPG